jgi:hypothetical protein
VKAIGVHANAPNNDKKLSNFFSKVIAKKIVNKTKTILLIFSKNFLLLSLIYFLL